MLSIAATDVNNGQCGFDWQMNITDARCTLQFVYPQNEL